MFEEKKRKIYLIRIKENGSTGGRMLHSIYLFMIILLLYSVPLIVFRFLMSYHDCHVRKILLSRPFRSELNMMESLFHSWCSVSEMSSYLWRVIQDPVMSAGLYFPFKTIPERSEYRVQLLILKFGKIFKFVFSRLCTEL